MRPHAGMAELLAASSLAAAGLDQSELVAIERHTKPSPNRDGVVGSFLFAGAEFERYDRLGAGAPADTYLPSDSILKRGQT